MCCVLDIIIVGNGKMGFSLADQLASEDHSITIVDTMRPPCAVPLTRWM